MRDRIPLRDDRRLIDLAASQFKVHPSVIEKRLAKATGVTVLEDGGVVVGYICYRIRDKALFVDLVVLDTTYKGKGIVSGFSNAFFEQAKRKGVEVIQGLVEKNNQYALAVFRHLGFSVKRAFLFTLLIEKRL
ncbi:GNAT family N-acetyltransferase [Ammoniphilus oxalaticus]|uniref:GNAT family N-acetyltransferase n=1 Tax=Ammoniphilus oxalaticus TaxID=66863 RepID=UPI001475931F|nr:GNAT family N-acetyltransferase [Ammoniphilus oxalaticus]